MADKKKQNLEQSIEEFAKEMKEKNKKEEKETMEEKNKKVELNVATFSKVQRDTEIKPKVVARYPYINEDGEFIYEVQKMQNAEEPYYVARPLENGEYKPGLGKLKTIPYNLPNVIRAKENGDVIIVTEGESKCNVFYELGYTATTGPFKGSDKWIIRFNKYLKHANVLVIADNDEEGRAFAENTFETISDAADNVGVIELSDICPQLKEGGDIEDLRNIVNNDEYLKETLDSIINDLLSNKEV
ncbi:MAG: hypothetical protein IJH39_01825 [Clostridia bacterium]|nr:hypothetical protein [Clostridia bacterium]